ncbi:MAG TPA: hypothetical protein VHC22_13250 [Pirellulales bacterium]|nr:hypothetical protein [Pirellulales bacterium]
MTNKPTQISQFSLAALLLTVAAVAAVLALMFQASVEIATPAILTIIPASLALLLIGIIYGKRAVRPFCIGAVVPVAMMASYVSHTLQLWSQWLLTREPNGFDFMDAGTFKTFVGYTLLLSIALGYLCVGFRWLVERRGAPEQDE